MDLIAEFGNNLKDAVSICLCMEQTFSYYQAKGRQFLSVPHIIQGVRDRFDSVSSETKWDELDSKVLRGYVHKILDFWENSGRVKVRGSVDKGGFSYCLNNNPFS